MSNDIYDELLSTIKNLRESDSVEIKRGKNLPDDFWPTYSSFSNTNGGIVILGIDEGNPPEQENIIIGVNNSNKIKNDLFNNLSNRNKVSYSALSESDIKIVDVDGKEVVMISIPEAPINKKPVYINDKLDQSFIRVSTGDVKMTRDQISEYNRLSSPVGDSEIISNYDINDLDDLSISAFKEIVSIRLKEKNFMSLDNPSFLREIGAIFKDRTSDKYNITAGALLFFGKNNSIKERFPKFFLDYIYRPDVDKRWVSRINSDMLLDKEINIFNFFRIVEEKLLNLVTNEFTLDENQTRESYNTLDSALREALVNSLVHTDYYNSDPKVKIEVNDGLYSFTNAGALNIQKSQFFTGGVSKIRNEILMKLFSLIGKSERQGFGGHVIYEYAAMNNKRLPDLYTDFSTTSLKIWNVDYMNDLPKNEQMIYSVLYKQLPLASRSQIIDFTNLSTNDFKKAIKGLLDKELIERTGQSRATRYKLKMSSEENLNHMSLLLKELKSDYVKEKK